MCFFAQILNILLKDLIYNAKMCMIMRKKNVFVTLCNCKPRYSVSAPYLPNCEKFMQICSAGEEISAVGLRPLAAKKGVRGVFVVIGKRATTKNKFGALFLLKP